MKLPTRNLPATLTKKSDEELEKEQLAKTDAVVAETKALEIAAIPVTEEKQLADMGLAPMPKTVVIPQRPKTPLESRTDSINLLLEKAYSNTFNLVLSEDESKKLTADFNDADFRRGAGGKDDLLYIEHQALRRRLSEVFGLHGWRLICRNNWKEEYKTKANDLAVRIYIDAVLCVRGCAVAEAIGEMSYFPSNPSQNYADAYEGAKSAALRRACKEFGIGLQAWNKDFCEGWKKKYPGFDRPSK